MREKPDQSQTMIELDDEQLEATVGGTSVGDRVSINPRLIAYCPGCSSLIRGAGEVVAFRGRMNDGTNIYSVKLDCCGYEMSAAEFALDVQ